MSNMVLSGILLLLLLILIRIWTVITKIERHFTHIDIMLQTIYNNFLDSDWWKA